MWDAQVLSDPSIGGDGSYGAWLSEGGRSEGDILWNRRAVDRIDHTKKETLCERAGPTTLKLICWTRRREIERVILRGGLRVRKSQIVIYMKNFSQTHALQAVDLNSISNLSLVSLQPYLF
jgi:hypothetical protein